LPSVSSLLRSLSQKIRRRNLGESPLERLLSIPRFQHGTFEVDGKPIEYVDASSFVAQFEEIWKREIYRVPNSENEIVILDCGANIGLSTLYFATRYPNAAITSFEPDPRIFSVLQKNCDAWNARNVSLHNAAVWINDDRKLSFGAEGADSGSLEITYLSEGRNRIYVAGISLRRLLQHPVYLLKIDIEGAEVAVLDDCRDCLYNVTYLFVEYHSFADQPQQLHRLLTVISESNFRFHLEVGLASVQPFIKRSNHNGMDQTVNIFAFRT
jgi:FkbM family methyltransferase